MFFCYFTDFGTFNSLQKSAAILKYIIQKKNMFLSEACANYKNLYVHRVRHSLYSTTWCEMNLIFPMPQSVYI